MKKKNVSIVVIILILLGTLAFFIIANREPSWENMQIKDFKIYSYKDRWENYPFPAEKIDSTLIKTIIPKIENSIDKMEAYKWKTNNNPYAFIYVMKLKEEPEKFFENRQNKEEILGEEAYVYNVPIDYEGVRENMKIYLFDENRFIFIVGGLWSFPEELSKKLIEKYPEDPTPSVIEPTVNIVEEQVKKIISY